MNKDNERAPARGGAVGRATSDSATTNLNAAIQFAERGWRVFPCHTMTENRCSCGKPECNSEAKHPRTRNGLKAATCDAGRIKRWWRRWADANVAVATGEGSGIFVLDIDGDEGLASLKELETQNGELPRSVQCRTGGGGRHYYFKHPGCRVKPSVGDIAVSRAVQMA